MTPHLSIDEQVAALEGALDPSRASHVDVCEDCRRTAADLRAVLAETAAVEVPEPSPLFWEHFSSRVRQATSQVAAEQPSVWMSWRLWTFGSVAAASLAAFVVWSGMSAGRVQVPTAPVHEIAAVSPTPAADVVLPTDRAEVTPAGPASVQPLTEIMQVASRLPDEELPSLLPSADASFEDLTTAERAAFVQLLHAEMEKHQ